MENPIYYKDLITPDDSITTLVTQLQTVIGKYGELKAKIQGDAAQMASSLKGVSAATEEQRKNIVLVTTESDKLSAQYQKIVTEEQAYFRKQQELNMAFKEQASIDKLIVQLNTSKEGSYNKLSAQYRLNKIRLNEMSTAERAGTEAGRALEKETNAIYKQMSELQKSTGKYTLEVGHYENAFKGLGDTLSRALPGSIRTISNGFRDMGNSLKSLGASDLPLASKALQGFSTVALGTVGILISFVQYLTGAGKTLREFEQANVNLSTILGVTAEEMKPLTDNALYLGRTTRYTATQITELQTELAKLGFGQGSILAMTKPVLQFALAVGANLGEAAEVAGATLRAFNLTSRDTEETLSTLAVATNNSALSFDRIKTSIGTVFPIANAYGLTVKDTVSLLGQLANAGFDASSAATATRNILLNLADSNGKLAKSLGGSVKTFDDMIEAMIKLRKEGVDVAEALELTDKRSASAFSAFLSGAESARELRRSLEEVSGQLDLIATTRAATTQGAVNSMKSAWEGLILAFQESNGMIRQGIEDLTEVIAGVQRLLFPTETFISESAQRYAEEFRAYYAENGAEAAAAYIQSFVDSYQKQADKLGKEAGLEEGLLNRIFGKKQKMAQTAQSSLQAVAQAAKAVTMQIENDAAEAAQKAAREAEQAAQEANAKSEKLSQEQKKAIEAAKKQRIADRKAVVESINLEIAATDKGTDKMLQLRLDKIEAERQVELEENRQKTTTERQDEAAINAKYNAEILQARKDFYKEVSQLKVQGLQSEVNAINLQIAVTREGTEEMLALRIEAIQKQRQIELEQNRQTEEKLRQDEASINAKYDRQVRNTEIEFRTELAMELLEIEQDYEASRFDLMDKNERQRNLFALNQEKERLQQILDLNRMNGKELTAEQVETIKNSIQVIEKESRRMPFNNLYEVLGISIDSKQKDALDEAVDIALESVDSLIESWSKEADAAREAAKARVEAAQTALDAEIEARNNGYANNVMMAQKELALAEASEKKAQEQQMKVQRTQMTIDTLTQTSSLITASANLWKAFSSIPYVGPALAIGAISTMWGSFTAAKVKAFQLAGTEQYGEGTVELLQGGSHASGNDIDMGTKSDGTRRRAEGGEFFAIINKKNSRKFRNVIPDVIKSFNDGSFAEKYQRASESMAGVTLAYAGGSGTDVSRLEKDVREIKNQGEMQEFYQNGKRVQIYKNLRRVIRND